MQGKVENRVVNSKVLPDSYIISFQFPHPADLPRIRNTAYRRRIAERFVELMKMYAEDFGISIINVKTKVNRNKNPTVHITTDAKIEIIEQVLACTETPPNAIYEDKYKK